MSFEDSYSPSQLAEIEQIERDFLRERFIQDNSYTESEFQQIDKIEQSFLQKDTDISTESFNEDTLSPLLHSSPIVHANSSCQFSFEEDQPNSQGKF